TDLRDLMGCSPLSDSLVSYLTTLKSLVPSESETEPEVKTYSDAVYMNYYALGISLVFGPKDGSKSITAGQQDKLKLNGIDVYNVAKGDSNTTKGGAKVYSTHPMSPIRLLLAPPQDANFTRPSHLELGPETSGKEFVMALGEPDRKGGGGGPSHGSIGIWCEWTKDGVMIEFKARGQQAWEQGKDAVWTVLTLFQP
ncbi:hypothetical protein BD410DRAFT_704039, partial [Rickenella mellea]